MKNRLITERYAALAELSKRTLASTTAINKVETLLRRYKTAYDAIQRAINDVIEANPAPETWTRDDLPAALAETRKWAVEAILDDTTPIAKVPDFLRLTDADVPKILKKDGGEDNVRGLSGIKVSLGGLYIPTTDEEKKFAGAVSEGEEPDEYVAPPVDERAPA